MNLASYVKELEAFLLTNPTEFQHNWKRDCCDPCGDQFHIEAGYLLPDYSPFDENPQEYVLGVQFWSIGDVFDQDEAEFFKKDLELIAREWCKRAHGFDGLDDDEPDFYTEAGFSVDGGCFTFSVPATMARRVA